jgi:hypothetical protein
LAIAFAWIQWFNPAQESLANHTFESNRKLSDLERLRPQWVGTAYELDMGAARGAGATALDRVGAKLKEEADRLNASLDREPGGSEAERLRRYPSAYLWAQDELKRTLLAEYSNHGVVLTSALPLIAPDSLKNRRGLRSLSEIPMMDRAFQMESLLLRAASRGGAFPLEPTVIQDAWQSAPDDVRFVEAKVTLDLALEGKFLPVLLRSLCELDGKGPTVSIESLDTSPLELPDHMAESAQPRVRAQIKLSLLCFRGKKET